MPLVGGSADSLWDGKRARATGQEVLEVPGADHSMQLPGDPIGSVDVLRTVTVAIWKFVGGFSAGAAARLDS